MRCSCCLGSLLLLLCLSFRVIAIDGEADALVVPKSISRVLYVSKRDSPDHFGAPLAPFFIPLEGFLSELKLLEV